MSIRLIRCNNSDPVTPFDDAVIFHSAKGHDYTENKRGGVFNKVYDQLGYIRDNVNHKFILRSGMGMLYGRQFEIPENENLEFSVTSLAGKYCVVYVEVTNEFVDMTGETDENDEPIPSYDQVTVTAQLVYSSEGYPAIGNTDIIANRYGTATMELYRFPVNAQGEIGDVIDRRYIYMPGVAEKARVLDANAIVNNRVLGNLIYPDKDMVKNTDHAYYADRASSLGTTGSSVNRNKIDDDLYLPNRDAHLVTCKMYQIKDANTTWTGGNTYTINGFPYSIDGKIIHAEIQGGDGTAACGYFLDDSLGGGISKLSLALRCNGGYKTGGSGDGSGIYVDLVFTDYKCRATVHGTNSVQINGSLYLVLYIIGGSA